MREVPEAERPAIGELVNAIKAEVEKGIDAIRRRLDDERLAKSLTEEHLDVTLPGIRFPHARLHPLTQVLDEIVEIFVAMGIGSEHGPGSEDDQHHLDAI